MGDSKYLIRVSCMTFNHASYIDDAMNGFCMQDTKFPFVCTIIDDASTDGEPDVIRRYLAEHFAINDEMTACKEETEDYVMQFAQHKTNKNCFFAVLFLKYNHYSIKKSKSPYLKDWEDTKYVAICEGDDYWTDSLKLQKQFDFMETHPECSMCFHASKKLMPSGDLIPYAPSPRKETYLTEDVIIGGGAFMATNAMFYCNELLQSEPKPAFWNECPIGDLPTALFFAAKGRVGYIDEVMSVYRVGVVGSWTSRQNTLKKRHSHYKAIIKMYNQYDEYTGFKYHAAINIKKNRNTRNHIKSNIVLIVRNAFKKIGIKL